VAAEYLEWLELDCGVFLEAEQPADRTGIHTVVGVSWGRLVKCQ